MTNSLKLNGKLPFNRWGETFLSSSLGGPKVLHMNYGEGELPSWTIFGVLGWGV